MSSQESLQAGIPGQASVVVYFDGDYISKCADEPYLLYVLKVLQYDLRGMNIASRQPARLQISTRTVL